MSDRNKINKTPASAAERDPADEYDMTGNVGRKGEQPSPAGRERGERSAADPAWRRRCRPSLTAIDTPRRSAHLGALGPMAEW